MTLANLQLFAGDVKPRRKYGPGKATAPTWRPLADGTVLLALDPSAQAAGWAILSAGAKPKLCDSGTFRPVGSPDRDRADELSRMIAFTIRMSRERGVAITAPATDAAKLWNGWGTALKPAWEPIIVAMKPLDGTFADNAQRHGVAGMNIDGGRIGAADTRQFKRGGKNDFPHEDDNWTPKSLLAGSECGRWPSNVIIDEEAGEILDAQTGELVSGKPAGVKAGGKLNCYGEFAGGIPVTGFGDAGGASRFFYTAKASQSERESHNDHPTVKPLALMKYLCELTSTPTGGIVLDPFMGSGTTLIAAREMGRSAIGIELNPDYCEIAKRRLSQGVLPFGSEVA